MLKWMLTYRQRCDLEMLISGGFAPLSGFLSRAGYENVLTRKQLTDGHIWPIPITLDVSEAFAVEVEPGQVIDLVDADNTLLAKMQVSDKWQPDKCEEAERVFGTQDITHPGVDYLLNKAGAYYLGGRVTSIKSPPHYDFNDLRHTPETLKQHFKTLGIKNIIGFQTRNPLHRAHMELTLRAVKEVSGHVLIHPVVGMTKPGDIEYYTRVRCYQKIMPYYPAGQATLSLLPLAMRMAGPRCALWHALIRKNYGCTHFIVGRDHAGPGNGASGKPFYPPYAAQELVAEFQDKIGITMLPFQEMVYVKERKHYCPANEVKSGETVANISGTELRDALVDDKPVPDWFSFPEVINELRSLHVPKHRQGFTVFFTGLSGAGKTTLARALMAKLRSLGRHNMTLLDGDIVRPILATDLGFSKKDRDLNIQRIGYVASEVTKTGGIAICAAIAPYEDARHKNRALISQHGGYIEVYVATPINICEQRDVKGLYVKARKGEVKEFTGISSPYETPQRPEISINTDEEPIWESIERIITLLSDMGYIRKEAFIAV